MSAIDWRQLQSTYESGGIVRDTVLFLASRDVAEALIRLARGPRAGRG